VGKADAWMLIFLAVVLKLPLALILWAIWKAAKLADRAEPPPPVHIKRLALCGYCGHRIAVGYDAGDMHRQATTIATSTGEAPFDVETRLIRAELSQPDSFAVEPTRCPGCGESGAWVAIETLDDVTARAIERSRRLQGS
jgi:hypothetical protein